MASVTSGTEPPLLNEFRREIRRLHGCPARFQRFETVPEAPGRGRKVVAVFALDGHPALLCFAWPEPQADGVAIVAVLRSLDIRSPADAVGHVASLERVSQERWSQEYA